MAIIAFRLNENLYLRDPQGTELGQNIIRESIKLVDTMGFEQFTFKKLADAIASTEASVYRYFENKHRLLIYLIDWYWTWLDHRLEFAVQNMRDPREKLRACLHVLIEEKKYDPGFAFVDEPALQRIVTAEFDKTYLTKQVDEDNRDGLFLPYKSVCKRIAEVAKEINPTYPYHHTLVSTVILSANHQLYYARHLPSLTDIHSDPQEDYGRLYDFCESLMMKALSQSTETQS